MRLQNYIHYYCKFTFTTISSLPCFHAFWHAIPTSFYIFNVLYTIRITTVEEYTLRHSSPFQENAMTAYRGSCSSDTRYVRTDLILFWCYCSTDSVPKIRPQQTDIWATELYRVRTCQQKILTRWGHEMCSVWQLYKKSQSLHAGLNESYDRLHARCSAFYAEISVVHRW